MHPRLIDKVVISQDRKSGIIYYTDNTMVNLSHSENGVLDLIAIIFSPKSHCDTWASYSASFEDTIEINMDLFNKVS